MAYDYEELYVAFLVYFNRDRDYFECHEVLEKLWLARDRDPLYKGLLQAAVGLYHFRDGNVRGGIILMKRAADRLKKYPPQTLGIDLAKLVSELQDYSVRLDNYEERPFAYYDLTLQVIDQVLAQEVEAASSQIKPNIPQRRGPQRSKASKYK
ncbi:DUF309 domain-containing protein [Paenibacillus sp. sgz500958]|uniref:DUF309 domain-containing protein n=1 Tax=Paenibacillus sp. sgz500958 TaxID=3242475 RepID=UPI0036D20F2C